MTDNPQTNYRELTIIFRSRAIVAYRKGLWDEERDGHIERRLKNWEMGWGGYWPYDQLGTERKEGDDWIVTLIDGVNFPIILTGLELPVTIRVEYSHPNPSIIAIIEDAVTWRHDDYFLGEFK